MTPSRLINARLVTTYQSAKLGLSLPESGMIALSIPDVLLGIYFIPIDR
jgi:hypothetical protein